MLYAIAVIAMLFVAMAGEELVRHYKNTKRRNEQLAVSQENARAKLRYRMQLEGGKLK